MVTVVDGYTKAGADAAFSPLGHTHDAGPSSGGVQGLLAQSFSFSSVAGQGTQIKPTSWVEDGSVDADGMYVDPGVMNFAYMVPAEDNRLYCSSPGIYSIRFSWMITFDGVAPTIVASTLRSPRQANDYNLYSPVAPARPVIGSVMDGDYKNAPHSSGTMSIDPSKFLADDWMADTFLWWNNEDTSVGGRTIDPLNPASHIPTLRVDIYRVG